LGGGDHRHPRQSEILEQSKKNKKFRLASKQTHPPWKAPQQNRKVSTGEVENQSSNGPTWRKHLSGGTGEITAHDENQRKKAVTARGPTKLDAKRKVGGWGEKILKGGKTRPPEGNKVGEGGGTHNIKKKWGGGTGGPVTLSTGWCCWAPPQKGKKKNKQPVNWGWGGAKGGSPRGKKTNRGGFGALQKRGFF